MSGKIYILGGYQTDFARNWFKEGKHVQAMINEAMEGAFAESHLEPADIEAAHLGNFAGGLYNMLVFEVVTVSQFVILVIFTSVLEIIITITAYRNIASLIGGEIEIAGLTKLV